MTERITESGQTGTNPEEVAELARKKGMAKGTAGASETGSEYEQGADGSKIKIKTQFTLDSIFRAILSVRSRISLSPPFSKHLSMICPYRVLYCCFRRKIVLL
jgi:hypothetical protein